MARAYYLVLRLWEVPLVLMKALTRRSIAIEAAEINKKLTGDFSQHEYSVDTLQGLSFICLGFLIQLFGSLLNAIFGDALLSKIFINCYYYLFRD